MKTREKNIEQSRNQLIENVRIAIGKTSSTNKWTDEEIYLILIFLSFPELLIYIRNICILERKEINYPKNIKDIYTKYLIERKEGHFITLPEISLFLYQVGFNLQNKETQNLAIYLSSIIDKKQIIPISIESINLKEALNHTQKYPSKLQKELFKNRSIKHYSNADILSILSNYILTHPEQFLDISKENQEVLK